MSSLSYSLVTASLAVTSIATVLNGICYATSKASPDVVSIILSALTCVALIFLGLLHHQNIQTGRRQSIYFVGGYLLIAAAASAGAMAMSPQESVFVVRSVAWVLSVFTQGLYCGFLAMTLAQEKSNPEWPRAYSRGLKDIPHTPNYLMSPSRVSDLSDLFEPKRGSLRKFPRRPSRYSETTLCPSSIKEEKSISIDMSSSTYSSPSSSPTRDTMLDSFPDRDTRPLLRSMTGRRRNAPTALSLDSLAHSSIPSPTTTICVESPTWEYNPNPFSEDNIHPLFRTTSPCPSPTFVPTMVRASSSAGQTTTEITTRMQSARSLRNQAIRTSSPLPRSETEEKFRPRATSTRSSFAHSPSEKIYDLNESPYE
ncbi:uncharacterized protein N7479_003141 [Penicillium vulpinum]|uniref:Uncharacterized protein n=1 Tax=Penicillium vulpinum TaxID=29845 RepID=A0A1V6S4E8_9EURO|nr:uncharacterized protein N7479_003141 [Penicillium vulpinum]KAJ5963265.1 hypothetical protein N7479_003141 [Penicillium vulpinum]OQE08614.1 hypothetical protein PENVUL_c009G07747 [Penicillium vulpinum]